MAVGGVVFGGGCPRRLLPRAESSKIAARVRMRQARPHVRRRAKADRNAVLSDTISNQVPAQASVETTPGRGGTVAAVASGILVAAVVAFWGGGVVLTVVGGLIGGAVMLLPAGYWKSMAAGLVVAVLLGWTLLSHGLSLPFMLGLFFFMLFGLVIGAVIFRYAEGLRPMPRGRVVAVTAAVSVACWVAALGQECLSYPHDFVEKALRHPRVYIPPNEVDRVEADLHTFIVKYLDTEYPPGGVIGYLRLAAAGRPVVVNIPTQPTPATIAPMVPAWVWWSRTVLSVVLMYVAVWSVTRDLAKPPKAAAAPIGAEEAAPASS